MKQALLIVSVLGICIAQMSRATETTFQSNNTSSSNTYSNNSDTYKSHVDEISRAIDSLSAHAKQKEYQQERAELIKRQQELAKKPNVRIGMTTSQVLHKSNWGYPADINTTINSYGKFEQWVYSGNKYLYFTNDKLTSIQY